MHETTKISIGPDSAFVDKKKLRALKDAVNKLAPTKKDQVAKNVEDIDLPNWFGKIEGAYEERREGHMDRLNDLESQAFDAPTEMQLNTSIQKKTMELVKEIWAQVVTTTCPHCKEHSPAVKRDGFTKLFVKPLQ